MSEAPSVGGGATTARRRSRAAAGPAISATAAQLIRRVLQASRDLDPLGLQAQLDLAATTLGLDRCVADIVVPATRQLGRLLATGERDAAQDLMATEAVRTWLNQRGSFAPSPLEMGPILLACGPRDRDVVGLESLALLLRYRRWPCLLLGSRTSTFTLAVAAQAADALGAVVSSTEDRGLSQANVSIRAVAALGIPVFYVGGAFESARSRRHVPGQYLGTRIMEACAIVIDSLAPTVSR